MSEKMFTETVLSFYATQGRHSLPWRHTRDPYHILVSETMLQQTQVERVIVKYTDFLTLFPDIPSLSEAPLGAVLRAWQGLGYNRRSKMLHASARILREKGGDFPCTFESLMELPGVGPYTAGAILAFAFDTPHVLIETNIRTVYLHHFFHDVNDVKDSDIIPYIERTLPQSAPREWYYALMDYGSYIKRTFGNPNSRSAHYAKQSTFKGSDREIRGAILKRLSVAPASRSMLHKLPFEDVRIDAQLMRLQNEALVSKVKGGYKLPEL